jgi:mRNA-degrading endonuclease toxin of MazEF toxin-antitoxin module
MKHFDEWNNVKKKIDSKKKRPPVRRGEIFWCSVGINIGVEYDGKGEQFVRPVLVLKKYSNEIVFGVPLTTKGKSGDWYCKLPHHIDEQESFAVLNQAKVYDTNRFQESMGELSESSLTIVLTCFFNLLKQ